MEFRSISTDGLLACASARIISAGGGMNRILGFLKEKLMEAKEENQAELQSLLSAIEFEAYSEARMLSLLQEVKTNYLEWNIMIANEASTGLYYTQIHNRNALAKHLRARSDSREKQERLAVVLQQMTTTLRELHAVDKLNSQWANTMSERVAALALRPTSSHPEPQEEPIHSQQLKQESAQQLKQESVQQLRGSTQQKAQAEVVVKIEQEPEPPIEPVPAEESPQGSAGSDHGG